MPALADNIFHCSRSIAYHFNLVPNHKMSISDLLGFVVETNPTIGVDRTGILDNRFKYKSISPIPTISENFNKTFEDICYETAQLLINLNKPISIFWSGGIDSTCLLATFMKLVSDPKQIRVVMTPKSIEEYPWFYEEKIKGHYDILMYHNFIHRYDPRQSVAGGHFAGDEIILTGSFGDQLFGSIKVVNNLDIKDMFWKEAFDNDMLFGAGLSRQKAKTGVNWQTDILCKKEVRDFIRDILPIQLKEAPFEIKTTFDLFWWLNFTIKWQCIVFRPLGFNTELTKKKFNQMEAFYDASDFQQWAMLNPDLKEKGTPETYKFPMKDVIYDFTKDVHYRDNKTKDPDPHSALCPNDKEYIDGPTREKLIIQKDKAPALIDSEFNNFYYTEILNTEEKFKKIITPMNGDQWISI